MHTEDSVSILPPVAFLPSITVEDSVAEYWLRQVTLRLRREVCWLWHERALLSGTDCQRVSGGLPPFVDRLGGVLDLARYDEEKRTFFAEDDTAEYLSRLIAAPPPHTCDTASLARGGFGWLAAEQHLEPVDCFVLALALAARIDSAVGIVFATCLNDPQLTLPTAALAQRLWDEPGDVLRIVDPGHRLSRYGLVTNAFGDWDAPLTVPPLVARQLVFPSAAFGALVSLPVAADTATNDKFELVVAHLRTAPIDRAQMLPILTAAGGCAAAAAGRLALQLGREAAMPAQGTRPAELAVLATLAWLRGLLLYVPFDLLDADGQQSREVIGAPLAALPSTLFVGVDDRSTLNKLAPSQCLPALAIPALSYQERLRHWLRVLPRAADDPELLDAVADCARRFRVETPVIDRLVRTLDALQRPPRPSDVYAVCRDDLDLGELAQPVEARFAIADLMLPRKQTHQIEDLIAAVQSLTTVHYEWGTARAWNESGLSALFAGAPGTGKTMAAEVIANATGMPLFRIDLSQVVNKYIGETEKNLRRVFDAADASDVILFFDEADALFGKRTEVKDAHDRYANLEVSYLLERMERFKGLAILATNRKKDLDEAFLRRLRYVVDFPLPGLEERLRIWRGVVPDGVDAGALDLNFLAERFPLAGGHIRAIVFDACLLSAHLRSARTLDMPSVIKAVGREMEKLGRPISLEQFAPYGYPGDC